MSTTSHRSTRVPWLAEVLFRLVTPRRERSFVLGDLREEFVMMLESGSSPSEARRWYWRQLFGSVVPGLGRLRRPRLPGGQGGQQSPVGRFRYDLRLALRALSRRPLFTAIAATTLALGIGTTVAMFSIVDGVLLTRLGYAEPERVVGLFSLRPGTEGQPSSLSYPDFEDLRGLTRTLSDVAAASDWYASAMVDGEPWRVHGQSVSGNYFDVLGVHSFLGRLFLPEEDVPGHEPVVVLSFDTWQERFGGDPGVLGRTLNVADLSYTIVGVAPPGLEVPRGNPEMWQARPDYFSKERASRGSHNIWPIARVAGGVAMDQVTAELSDIAERLEPLHPFHEGQRFQAIPILEVMVGSVRPTLLTLLAAGALVLLIACANVANLLLSRATERSREMAVRAALGAYRTRLIQQLLLESVLLALLGGALGMGMAHLGTSLLGVTEVPYLPRAAMVRIDGAVLAVALCVSALTVLIFGLFPALQVSTVSPARALQEGGRGRTVGRSGRSTRQALIVAEIAFSVLLAGGAGLVLKSFDNLFRVDTGFRTENLLTFRLTPSRQRYADQEEVTQYYREVIERLSAVPGVTSASAVSFLPLTGSWDGEDVIRADRPPPDPANTPNVEARAVTPAYFTTLGIRVLRGRGFTAADNASSPDVAVLSEGIVRRLFPGEDPIGKSIRVSNGRPCEIVGVVADVRNLGMAEALEPTVYGPHAQRFVPWIRQSMSVVLRTGLAEEILAKAVHEAVWAVDPAVPIAELRTMDAIISDDVAVPRLRTAVFTSFALLALVLSAVGVAGVMAYSVSQRQAEIGIRLALGAEPGRVIGLVIRDGATPVLLGLTLGFLGVLSAGRVIESMLFMVEPRDPLVLIAVSLLLSAVALCALWIPAVGAARVRPIEVLTQH